MSTTEKWKTFNFNISNPNLIFALSDLPDPIEDYKILRFENCNLKKIKIKSPLYDSIINIPKIYLSNCVIEELEINDIELPSLNININN
mgnify:CR=1 FL=1